MKVLLSLFVLLALTGCKTLQNLVPEDQIVVLDASKVQTLTYQIPIVDQVPGASSGKPFLGFRDQYASKDGYTRGYQFKQTNDGYIVSKYKGFQGKIGYNTYKVLREDVVDGGTLLIKLTPQTYESKIPFDLRQSVYEPGEFAESDLIGLLSEAELGVRFEVDSQYPVDSTASNFKRLAKPLERSRYSLSQEKEATGNLTRVEYEVNGTNGSYPVGIEVFPYKEGSKVVAASSIVGIMRNEHLIDFNIALSDVTSATSGIVNN
jgi:hypothetical protein